MAIPNFQECMLPVLVFLSDNEEHTNIEIVNYISDHFKLTEEERKVRIPSGLQNLIYSRVYWAKTYLKKALLIDQPARSINVISNRGKDVLKENNKVIDVKYLMKFKEFQTYHKQTRKEQVDKPEDVKIDPIQEKTPFEMINDGIRNYQANINDDILELVKKNSPAFFERIVVELLVRMGYGGSYAEAASVVGKSGDGGIDGVIKEDRLGLDIVYIQAKRWEGNVGSKELQSFVGALASKKSKKGVFITTSGFTKQAFDYARGIDHNIVLIDGDKLASLMFEFNLGVSVQQTIAIKQLDYDFFEQQ